MLAFGQLTVTIAQDFAVVHEYIRRTFTLNESEALLSIEPFYDTTCTFLSHWGIFLSH